MNEWLNGFSIREDLFRYCQITMTVIKVPRLYTVGKDHIIFWRKPQQSSDPCEQALRNSGKVLAFTGRSLRQNQAQGGQPSAVNSRGVRGKEKEKKR